MTIHQKLDYILNSTDKIMIYLGNIKSTGQQTIDLSSYNIDHISVADMRLLGVNNNVTFNRDAGATYKYSLGLTINSFTNGVLKYTIDAHPLKSEQSFYIASHSVDIYLVSV